MNDWTKWRAAFASIIVVSSALLVGAAVTSAAAGPSAQEQSPWTLTVDDQYNTSNPEERSTVVTAHITGGDIWQFSLNGTEMYHNDTRDGYWDVDPVPGTENTVVYAATDEVHNQSLCQPTSEQDYCIRQMIERANLTTGETEVLYSRVDPWYRFHEWHDVDRIDDSRYIVADMYSDEVFIVNVTTGIVTWEWNMQNSFSLTSGGQYPNDWSHINDVELLEDGRVMISPRNHDQVLFIDQQTGLQENWTLGADDRHSVLYEQHNPDYFTADEGGPAVLVADSQNDRIIEYGRTQDGGWEQTWVWQDDKLEWPRDADRLPNGHTLITDTTGGRVVEVNQEGEVVWNLTHANHSNGTPVAYEAERMNTGDESAGGESAESLGLQSRTASNESLAGQPGQSSSTEHPPGLIPDSVEDAVSSAIPVWMEPYHLVLLLIAGITAIAWLGVELWRAGVRPRRPVVRG